MSNQLSMATHQSIETLHGSGHSNREIARLLSIDRGAVNKHVRLIRAESQALKESDSGSDEIQNRPNPRTGSTEKHDEKTSKLDHFPPKPWPVLTRKQVAGFNPRTDTVRLIRISTMSSIGLAPRKSGCTNTATLCSRQPPTPHAGYRH